ncbi:MAG: Crp/Fnr family transcriptional regulator [Bacteroidota bacterium]|nr:Crp/Fnr family transcriptional regulator [Bacteroidota bacterium]
MPEKNNIINCESCPVRWIGFQHLGTGELQMINDNRYEAVFKPGEIMIKQGSPASNALFLASGIAKTYIEGLKGRNFIMSIAQPGRLIMGPGAYVNLRYTYSVAAITFVQACFVHFDILRHLVKVNGDFAEDLLKDISTKSLRSHTRMVNLAQKKMPGRLAEVLLYFADEVFHADEYEMILSRKELGEMTNMAKESVVRILRDMEESGVISSTASAIRIIDRNMLTMISEKG